MYTLTTAGEKSLFEWLETVVRNFESQSRAAWVSQADDVPLMAEDWENLVFEVRANESITGNPETLTMPRAWFDKVNVTE